MKITNLLILLLVTTSAFAENFSQKFVALKKAGDAEAIKDFLQNAATKEAENPNYYATAANYWWGVAQKSGLNITPVPEGRFNLNTDDLSLIDPKTGKKVGEISTQPKAQTDEGKHALNLLTQGRDQFPHRADIALGLAHIQKESDAIDQSITTLISLLEHAKKFPKSLKWMDDGELPSPAEKFLPEIVQNYTAPLFREDSPATDQLCARLLDAVIATYPDHPYAYNLKAALSDATGKPEEALKMLELAHQKSPSDSLVLFNLAETYAKQDHKTKAITAYQNLLKLDLDQQTKEEAQTALKELKTNDQ